jgi:hypothetical protein
VIAQLDRDYLRFGAARSLRRLASYGLFEGRPLTTKGRFINPAVFAFLRLLAAWPGTPQMQAPVFVTGLGRSGTTILGMLLSMNADVGYLNEPKALWHVIDPRQDINGNYSLQDGRFRLDAADVDEPARRRAHRLFQRYLALMAVGHVVDKYPELIFRVDYVRAIFPGARFIFITRSGADVVPSVVNWSERLGVNSGGVVDDWWGRNDLKWSYFRQQLVLEDESLREVWHLVTPTLDPANRAALEWIVTMREGQKQWQRMPAVICRVSYEDLIADPAAELDRLQRFCGLTPDPAVLAYARGRLYDNPAKQWPVLDPAIDALFRATMVSLGYTVPQ